MTVEEALAASVVEPVNDIFEIDPETRVITVRHPKSCSV